MKKFDEKGVSKVFNHSIYVTYSEFKWWVVFVEILNLITIIAPFLLMI